MMNPVPWLQMTNMISYQGLVRTFPNRSHIGAGGTLTMSVNKVVNGGYRCGFLGWATCGKGTISTTNLVLNSSHKYASEMGGTQQFKSATINTIN